MRHRIATLTSNTLNPFLVSLTAILILTFESTSGVADALKWSLILAAISVLPVLTIVVYLVKKGWLDSVLTASRRQRTVIYLLSILCAAVGYLILHYSRAPLTLEAAFAGGLFGAVLFTGINLVWKISLHAAFIAALATILIIFYGWIAATAIMLVLMVAWARLTLRLHSPAQVAAGTLLASIIVVVVFSLFGVP
ncbi:MAG: hypothetical protein JSV77_00260 [Dehalococcoidales bacterium]|nr:MAG: hypothetical protein JSV77_00260 [Dehalococcoidales bacterium]